MTLAQTDSLSRDQLIWSCRAFLDHYATALGVLIICTTRHATVCCSAQRRPPCRKLLCNLSHPATKKLRRSDVRAWRGNVATLVHIGLAGHSERVTVAIENILVCVGAIIPIIQSEVDPVHLVLGSKRHQLNQRSLLVTTTGCAIGEA